MDEDDLEYFWRDYWTRPKQVYQGITRHNDDDDYDDNVDDDKTHNVRTT
jgi:hypothetical protein